MKTIATTHTYTLRMDNDCTLHVYDAHKREVYESDPNASLNAIQVQLFERMQEFGGFALIAATANLMVDIIHALQDVEGFAGGELQATDDRVCEMMEKPSWQLLGWLL